MSLDPLYSSGTPICIIPSRGRSPNLPKKNFKRLNDKPLVTYTIDTAVESCQSDRVFVSTESNRIAEIARDAGAQVPFLRPKNLAEPDTTLRPVIRHALTEIEKNVRGISVDDETPIVILQPNVPFRQASDIESAIKKYTLDQPDSVISVTDTNNFYWQQSEDRLRPLFSTEKRIANNSDQVYQESGSITVTSPDAVRKESWPGSSVSFVETNWISSFKIDTLTDFWLAEKISQGPHIIFRTDGGGDLGLGKVYRALTIADELKRIFECEITFISNTDYPEGISLIESHGYEIQTIKTDTGAVERIRKLEPDIILLDVPSARNNHYDKLYQLSAAVVDFENIYHDDEPADIIINPQQTLEERFQANYLNGPEYLVIRDEFRELSNDVLGPPENILLTFGGTDPLGLTVDAVSALGRADLEYNYRVVLGPGFENDDSISSLSDQVLNKFEFYRNVNDMSEMMDWADLAVTAGGRTVYELAATGTPSIVIAQNDGEVERMELLNNQGAIDFFGHGKEVNFDALPDHINKLSEDVERLSAMSSRGEELVDGKGLDRILDIIRRMFVGI